IPARRINGSHFDLHQGLTAVPDRTVAPVRSGTAYERGCSVSTALKVLIVEDEFLIAAGIAAGLESAGYTLGGNAASEEAALRLHMHHRPELAVVDVNLQKGDGISAAGPMTATGTSVLFVTADEGDREKESGLGTACLGKPFTPSVLIAAVRAVAHIRT